MLIVVVLLSLISLGFFNLHIFSQEQVFQADKRAKVQNEVSFILEHMTKAVKGTAFHGGAIGDWNNPPITLLMDLTGAVREIQIRTDWNNNGRLEPPVALDPDTDKIIVYQYVNHIIRFYPNWTDDNTATGFEVLTNRAVILGPFNGTAGTPAQDIPSRIDYTLGNNFFDITLSGCWNPDDWPDNMRVLENPQVTMTATINMPSVGVN